MKNEILELRKSKGFTQDTLAKNAMYQDRQLMLSKMIDMILPYNWLSLGHLWNKCFSMFSAESELINIRWFFHNKK